MNRSTLLALALAAAACGSHSESGSNSKPESEQHEHEMESMSPELARFHDVLAPHWHAAKGAQRVTDTCGAIDEFKSRADAVAKAMPAGAQLVAAVQELERACAAENQALGFDAAFGKVHEAFHHLLEAGK